MRSREDDPLRGCGRELGYSQEGAWFGQFEGIYDNCSVSSNSEPLLTPAEVAAEFGVDPKTVTRWANEGRLSSIRTLGGHRRFPQSEVKSLRAKLVFTAS